MKKFPQFILMDNFRGFSKTVVPLANTNFFVGENSSGKSSVLALLKIITDFFFWHRPEFKTEDINFAHSSDIISASSDNKSTFGIGYLNDNNYFETHERNDNYFFSSGFYITFKDKNGSPEPQYFSIAFAQDKLLTIKFEPKKISYKILNNFGLRANTQSEAQLLLTNLIDAQDNPTGFTKFSGEGSKNIFDTLFLLLSRLRKDSKFDTKILGRVDIVPNVRPVWLAPIRSKPKRTYDEPIFEFSPEGNHTPYVISSILSNKKSHAMKTIIEMVGREAGLFKEMALKKYGRTKNAPFELDFVIDETPLSMLNVGYGVSQSIPIITEIVTRPKKSFFIIQQPEVHLHPKAQASIGTLLFNAAEKWGNRAIIETHSDYMIDRFRIMKKKEHASKETEDLNASMQKSTDVENISDVDSQIVFFTRKNGVNTVCSIAINEAGELEENQPDEYREFFINEQVELLGL